jgi:hypothetical protein
MTQIDVFVERLNFCHTIELAGRLSAHPVTIPIEELLLQKVQIVEMTTTDLIDAGVLLATHDVAAPGGDSAAAVQPLAHDRDTAPGEWRGRPARRLLARDWASPPPPATWNASGRCGRAAVDVGEEGPRGPAVSSACWRRSPRPRAWPGGWDKVGERKQWWQDVDDRGDLMRVAAGAGRSPQPGQRTISRFPTWLQGMLQVVRQRSLPCRLCCSAATSAPDRVVSRDGQYIAHPWALERLDDSTSRTLLLRAANSGLYTERMEPEEYQHYASHPDE